MNNKMVNQKVRAAFQQAIAPAIPEIEWEESDRWHKYNAVPYSTNFAKFALLVDAALKGMGYPDGVFSNKRNAAFQQDVDTAIAGITPEQVVASQKRFKTMFD